MMTLVRAQGQQTRWVRPPAQPAEEGKPAAEEGKPAEEATPAKEGKPAEEAQPTESPVVPFTSQTTSPPPRIRSPPPYSP